MTDTSLGIRIKEVFADLDIKEAMSLIFGKCPHCKTKLVRGHWLQWCDNRACRKHTSPLNADLADKVKHVAPTTATERQQIELLAAEYGVQTR